MEEESELDLLAKKESLNLLLEPETTSEIFGIQNVISNLIKEVWIQGFKSGYLYDKPEPNKEIKKPYNTSKSVKVFLNGLCVYTGSCLNDVSAYTGLSNSRICILLHSKKKSTKGYFFTH